MKHNILIKTESGSHKAIPRTSISDASGIAANLSRGGEEETSWVAIDAEDVLIQSIDEQRYPQSSEKKQASRFLAFLGNRRLTLEKLKELSVSEQLRLKREFLLGE